MLARIARLLPEIALAVRRFPEAATAALLATALAAVLVAQKGALTEGVNDLLFRAYGTLALSFPILLAIGLRGERHEIATATRVALSLGVLLTLATLVSFPFALDVSPPLLMLFAGLTPALLAHLGEPRDNVGYWRFNHDLWLGLVMAVIGGALVWGSFAAVLATLSSLFQIDIPDQAYAQTGTFAANLAGPLIWLTLAPKGRPVPTHTAVFASQDAEAGDPEIAVDDTSSRAIALVAKFILVPVLLVYTAIIYVYAAKIALDGVLPKGQIGWIVLGYGATGTATLLATYPTRRSGGLHVALFDRYWFVLALLPVALLFLAVLTRTDQYGVTERRYIVLMFGVWLVLQALLFGLRPSAKRDLRVILGSLLALVTVAMAGPWGAVGLTTRQLAAEFRAIAASSPAFKDGKFDAEALTPQVRSRLLSIVQAVGENGRLDLLAPAVAGHPDAKTLDLTPESSARERETQSARFADAIGLPGSRISPATTEGRTYFYFNASLPVVLEGGRAVAGPIILSSTSTLDVQAKADFASSAVSGQAFLTPRAIRVNLGTLGEAHFDLKAMAEALSKARSGYDTHRAPMRFSANEGGLSADVYVVGGQGYYTDTNVEITSLTLWFTWQAAPKSPAP